MTETTAKKDVQKLQRLIVDALEDVKAQDLKVFDTEHLSPLFERVIIASGTSNRQTKALAASVRDKVRDAGFGKPRIEGEDNGEWIIADCGAVVVHVMQPNIRAYYRLEELWGDKEIRQKFGAPKPEAKEPPVKKPKKSELKKEAKAAAKASGQVLTKPATRKAPVRKAASAKPAAKTGAKSSAKTPAKVPTKAPTKTAAKPVLKAPAKKAPTTAPTKVTVKERAKTPAKSTAAKTTAKTSAKSPAKAPLKSTAKTAVKTAAKTATGAARKTVKPATRKS